MRNLIIINAGKFGREVFAWSKNCNEIFMLKGFLDNRPNILDDFNYNVKILGNVDTYIPEENDVFICAIGDVFLRHELCNIMLAKNAKFVNIIHNSVVLGENVKLGIGIVICPNTVISSDVTIEDFVCINISVTIAHDVIIKKYCQINSNTTLSGNCFVDELSTIHGNSYLIPNVSIGKNTVIGAGSIVLKNIKENAIAYGNPAKVVLRNKNNPNNN